MRYCCLLLAMLIGCASPEEVPAPSTTTSNTTETAPPATPGTSPGTATHTIEPTSTTATGTTPATATSPAPRRPDRQPSGNVEIAAVDVKNPIVITGRARTFENNVALRVRNARGEVIAEDFTTATGEMGQFSPFRGEVWLTRDPGARITAQAFEYSAKDGSERSVDSMELPFGVPLIEAKLYLATPDCNGTVVETRRVPKSISHARLLIEALMRSRNTPFPPGSDVKSMKIADGVATVDFNERLRNVGGACRAQMIREMVTRTLTTLPNVKRVVIKAEGSEALALQP